MVAGETQGLAGLAFVEGGGSDGDKGGEHG
jgi:hypothetical protein